MAQRGERHWRRSSARGWRRRVVQNDSGAGVAKGTDYRGYSGRNRAFEENIMADPKHSMDVQARVTYLADQSDIDARRYVFAYTITVTNTGTVPARLVSRHWIITDSNNTVQEVKGEGVVGEQPLLAPHQSFTYTSGTYIATPVGTMRGSYRMVADDGEEFDATIPEFALVMPGMLH
jgi:ApaG protein